MTNIVIAAGLMVVLDGRDPSTNFADTSRGIKEGSVADFKATITNGNWSSLGRTLSVSGTDHRTSLSV